MKMKLVYLMAAAVALNFSTLAHADDNAPKRPEGRPGGEGRGEIAKQLGLNPEEMKDLSPEERRAKFREAIEKKKAELEKKKADGTLTDREKEMLQRIEERRSGQGGPGGPGRGEGGREEMAKMVKALGLDPEELKKLPPEERQAKLKEAADKKYAELQKKKDDGSISDDEKKMLQRMEERRKWREEHGGKGPKPGDQK